nr:Chain 0, peptide 15-10-3 [synthetic construct]6WKX_1 Chain 1, peptide 15-10-3 [synthetic construct]6WKX_2 Chain 2, peptide 15-10-3 [synthetic construct]6WKX_3 Chain 3, peptide 15-10-3 [synthetic construct]6WKX_4 Chain 4, peptide 15-10-3 [synthetic construct]6WKX_5 Chain 5, peptide 15-10-3 [synthetic construct]6WKX_6 Chain 6, peptide 15-10-3 [synthetic construct]6WKX_7 Chain 7, peptide 15-10-3 [synthetic construct]6WKX_8 Chain 8, peptide 15-10-3 [synthetic construct]6WKX_9 Chain 9, pepti
QAEILRAYARILEAQ